jgi:hypothetical protein
VRFGVMMMMTTAMTMMVMMMTMTVMMMTMMMTTMMMLMMMMVMMVMILYFCRTRNMYNKNVGFSLYLLSAGKHPVPLISKYGYLPNRKMETNKERIQ